MNTAAAVKAEKPRVDLSTATPDQEPVAPPESDTSTPDDISVMPFTMMNLPKWGLWLQLRLGQIWPHITDKNYMGLIMAHMGSNWSMFIRARKALVLAVLTRETFEPRPVVDVVFCFKHVIADEAQDADVALLFSRVEKWAATHGAREIRILNQDACDLPKAFFARDTLWGKKAHYLAKAVV